jgi:hypothetical protein
LATGLGAMALLFTLLFLGRLLPWDDHGAVSWVVAKAFVGLPSPTGAPPDEHVLTRLWILHVLGATTLSGCVALHFSWRAALRESGFVRSTLPIVAALALAALVILAIVSPTPLHAPFDGFTPTTTVSAEWTLRWLQLLAERSPWLARAGLLSLVGLSVVSVAARTPSQRRGCRWAWAAVLASLLLLSALPIGRPEGP